MKQQRSSSSFLLFLLFLVWNHQFFSVVSIPIITTIDSTTPSNVDVKYNCIFENQWTSERHPKEYPYDASSHWTRQIIVSHSPSSKNSIWKEGALASDAVRIMAENGGTADLIQELERQSFQYKIGYEKYNRVINPILSFHNPLEMTPEHHSISVIAKMSPSPDWFSGFHDFNAINEETATWYSKFSIETYPYDAGTEDGMGYSTVNTPTNPRRPIAQFTSDTTQPPYNDIFVNTNNSILPVAKYTCTLNTYSSSRLDIDRLDSTIPAATATAVTVAEEEDEIIQYNCMLTTLWNPNRHPNGFPLHNEHVNRLHWTKQIVTSHDRTYSMWKEGSIAKKGIQMIAEQGDIADIVKELQNRGESYDIGYDQYYDLQQQTNTNNNFSQEEQQELIVYYEPLLMTSRKRYLSAITKLSPGPDWFTGFHDFNAVNEEKNVWYQEFTIPIYPYDAGTMDGTTYEEEEYDDDISNNNNQKTFVETVPVEPITQFTKDTATITDNDIFLNYANNKILPVGIYSCTLSTSPKKDGSHGTTSTPNLFWPGLSPTTTEFSSQQHNNYYDTLITKKKAWNIIGSIIVGIIVLIISMCILAYTMCRKRKRKDVTIMIEKYITRRKRRRYRRSTGVQNNSDDVESPSIINGENNNTITEEVMNADDDDCEIQKGVIKSSSSGAGDVDEDCEIQQGIVNNSFDDDDGDDDKCVI